MSLKEQIDTSRIPSHVAIIMDGNGRWAKARKKIRLSGHNEGAKSLRRAVETSIELGVKYLTVYAFSTENWNRPKAEVSGLMELLVKSINNEFASLHKNGVRIKFIGDLSRLPQNVLKKVDEIVEKTKDNRTLTLVIAISYSGRWDILNAAKKMAEDVKINNLDISEINETQFESYLSTYEIPDPELLIRTSGEERISNFLLYQLAYSELYFTDVLWPDFDREIYFDAIINYQNRERRFGKTSEQLKK